jgi:hypothetical protein
MSCRNKVNVETVDANVDGDIPGFRSEPSGTQ